MESLEATADTEAIERVAVMNRAALDDGRPQ
jgi:hypothetical protein